MHNADLSQRLRSAENDFLTALQSGSKLLSLYHQSWSTLPDMLQTASRTGTVSQETLSLAHSVASRVANLASCFLDITCGEESYTTSLQNDCDTMLLQIATLNLTTQAKPAPPENGNGLRRSPAYSSSPNDNAETPYPPFLTSAHQWLMNNLHNPYPTAEVKGQIATASSCAVSSISSWFINVRRRIGWTTLCREHFANCRADMIDAAYRAYVEEDPQHVLSPELRHSFATMKVVAETLYSSNLSRSAFGGELDSIVKNLVEEQKGPLGDGKHHQVEQINIRQAIQGSHPYPGSSIAVSPVSVPDATATDENEEEVVPPILAGSKRRQSSIESVNQPPSTTGRATKRLRTFMAPQRCLPSLPSSTDSIKVPSDSCAPRHSSSNSIRPKTNQVIPSSERQPSEEEAGLLKPSHDPTVAPRYHIASDFSPRSNMEDGFFTDDWFNTELDSLFAIPPPVETAKLDFSASWEVELFRNYEIPIVEYSCAPITDPHMSTMTDLFSLDSLLQPITSDPFATVLENVPPSNTTGPPSMVSLDSSIPDISHIDWMSLLNGSDTYQSITDSAFSQNTLDFQSLSEIDISTLQLPPIVPAAPPQGDLASKQAKLDQLHAMQEAVRRMERELQSEGVIM